MSKSLFSVRKVSEQSEQRRFLLFLWHELPCIKQGHSFCVVHDYNLSESPIDDFSFFTHNVQVFKLRYEFLILARAFSSVSPAICFSAVK